MRTLIAAFCLLTFCSSLAAAQENHGATLTWGASPTQTSCVSPCTWSYNVLEGTAGNETTKLNTSPLTVLTLTDDGPNMNSYLGQTRCYVVQFQEVLGGLTLTANAPETCVAFPSSPSSATTIVITVH